MGENLMSRAYVKDFESTYNGKKKITREDVLNKLNESRNSLQSKRFISRAVSQVQAIYISERQKEEKFLQQYGNLQNKNIDFKTLISEFNIFFGSVESYEAILDNLLTLPEKLKEEEEEENKQTKTNTESEFYSFFRRTIPKALTKAATENIKEGVEPDVQIIKQDMIKNIEDEFREKFNPSKKGKMPKKEYSNIQQALSSLNEDSKNIFFASILEEYKITPERINDWSKKINEWTNKKNANEEVSKLELEDFFPSTFLSSRAGFAFEALDDLCLSFFKNGLSGQALSGDKTIVVSNIRTSSFNNMKADQYGTVTIATEEGEIDLLKLYNSVKEDIKREEIDFGGLNREENREAIKRMKQKLKEMKAKGGIFEISDKNYRINGSDFLRKGGFGAETPNLRSLKATLENNPVIKGKVKDLIFVLVNSGEAMINGKRVKEAKRAISFAIADFLFDDVEVLSEEAINETDLYEIHIFNLNGLYVPLSVLLEGFYNALININEQLEKGDPQGFVQVNFHAENESEPEEGQWKEFYNRKMQENKVEIHFFRDFISFVRNVIPKVTTVNQL